ncbi:hypothetical protein Tco_0464047 [Tanacetum coccineum]
MKEVVKETRAKRKKSIPRKSTRKRQKLEEDAEKEELKGFMDIIPREEVPMEVESLSTQSFACGGSTCDVEELYRLVKERYSTSRPEGYDLMLWGDLHTLFEPDEEREEIPLNQVDDLQEVENEIGVDHEEFTGNLKILAADLEISMHGDYYGMLVTDPKREVIEALMAWSGQDMRIAKTCYHSHSSCCKSTVLWHWNGSNIGSFITLVRIENHDSGFFSWFLRPASLSDLPDFRSDFMSKVLLQLWGYRIRMSGRINSTLVAKEDLYAIALYCVAVVDDEGKTIGMSYAKTPGPSNEGVWTGFLKGFMPAV